MPKTPFEHIKHIFEIQKISYYDELDDEDKKNFNVYIINMGLSMNPNYLGLVNEANKYWDQLGSREIYLFYSQSIPKKKQYYKWIKKQSDTQFSTELIQVISKYFECSNIEAERYLKIFHRSDEGKEEIIRILKGFGWTDKQIKKYGKGK